jgi:hypothetical protein
LRLALLLPLFADIIDSAAAEIYERILGMGCLFIIPESSYELIRMRCMRIFLENNFPIQEFSYPMRFVRPLPLGHAINRDSPHP